MLQRAVWCCSSLLRAAGRLLRFRAPFGRVWFVRLWRPHVWLPFARGLMACCFWFRVLLSASPNKKRAQRVQRLQGAKPETRNTKPETVRCEGLPRATTKREPAKGGRTKQEAQPTQTERPTGARLLNPFVPLPSIPAQAPFPPTVPPIFAPKP